jgi:formylglycine-generating enzyme required for sulfatase activity
MTGRQLAPIILTTDQNCPNDWRDNDVNDGFSKAAPVESFMKGRSPYDLVDMAGNVWEWTSSKDFEYPYQKDDGRENVLYEAGARIVRGGSWAADGSNVRCATRWGVPIDELHGFRVVISGDKP